MPHFIKSKLNCACTALLDQVQVISILIQMDWVSELFQQSFPINHCSVSIPHSKNATDSTPNTSQHRKSTWAGRL